MEGCREYLVEESDRILNRPRSMPPQFLTCIEIIPLIDQNTYCKRLRRVIHSAVSLSCVQDFEREVLDDAGIPTWFAFLTDDVPAADGVTPKGAREGVVRYFGVRGGDKWDLQEWLFMFDPDLRTWSWWDVVGCGGGGVYLYIDTNGEIPVPCEELWWSIFVSGAQSVGKPFLISSDYWEEKSSMGTLPAG